MSKDLLWQAPQYGGPPLEPEMLDADPIVEFRAWFQAATAAGCVQPNAMTLATVGAGGRPSARIVLLKELDDRGFVFFGNYDSRKGRELAAHAAAALVFFWEPVHRQVRVEGTVERITAEESDAYFSSRPRGSQLGAIASPQSQVIPDRGVLDRRVAELTAELAERAPPRPPHWGGYRLVPDAIEFWQGRTDRLHDRIRYRRDGGVWIRERLAP